MGVQEIAMIGGAVVLLVVVGSAVAWVKKRTNKTTTPA